MRILHIVRSFGNKSQPYTTNFLEKINTRSNNIHSVFADVILNESSQINTYSSKYNLVDLVKFSIIFNLFFDPDFKEITQKDSFKSKIKFILKWNHLLGYDLIHIHHLQVVNVSVLKLLKKKNIRLVCSLRGRDVLVNTNDEKLLAEFKNKIELFDCIHVISKFVKAKLETYNLLVKSIVVYRGNNQPEEVNKKIYSARKSDAPINMIVTGRLVWEKGHIYMLDTISRLKQNGYQIKLDLYGQGVLLENISFRLKQLDLESEINLKGHIELDVLRSVYKNYDLALQPSLTEALSNSVLDFSFHNLPVVISNVGGMPEIIEDKVNGSHFDINNINTMDESILNCLALNNEELIKYNDKIRSLFSIENEIYKMDEIYNALN